MLVFNSEIDDIFYDFLQHLTEYGHMNMHKCAGGFTKAYLSVKFR
jgi:hypothetical protein